jgi:pyruvate,water dikinase
MAIGQLRRAVLAAAHWLVARGALTTPDEIFRLFFDEIFSALRAESPVSFSALVAARQAEHSQWEKLEAPPILGVPGAQLSERPSLPDQVTPMASRADAVIIGLGASPGQCRGRARVVAAHVPLPDLSPGDVLVSENAGPRWTPLFPILGGLVLDEGSFGQHAAATAREYDVPTVIQTRDATRRIPDEAWVIVDGTNGTVSFESNSAKGISQG